MDLEQNVKTLHNLGIPKGKFFIPPYEWYNSQIVKWADELGYLTYNYTSGLRTPADYTYPDMQNRYWSSERLMNQLRDYEINHNLNGFIILIHLGTDSKRKDKFYLKLEEIIDYLRSKKYNFVSLEKL